LPPEDREKIIKTSLERLYVIKPKDSFQFALSLKALPTLLQSYRHFKVLIVDSLSAFFWIDKIEENIQRQNNIIRELVNTVSSYNLVLFSTVVPLFKTKKEEYLPNQWTNLEKFRFSLSRDQKRPENYLIKHETSENVFSFKISDHGIDFLP
jgi:hypothetical protein